MTENRLIVHQGKDWLVANKPSGLPAVPDKTADESLMEILEKTMGHKLHPIHRIDRPVSGLVVFGAGKKAASYFSDSFRNNQVKRLYLAVVASRPKEDNFKIQGWIKKSRAQNRSIFSTEEEKGGKSASACIKYLDSIDNYHLLGLKLESGRYHQLRAMLQHMGCPVKGDVKYGARRKNKDRSIHLHAWKLLLPDPDSRGEPIELTADLPDEVVWKAFDMEKTRIGASNWLEWT